MPSWNVFDGVEGLLHELTHTLLMLDELRFSHYPDYQILKKPENLAKSAIRVEPRPLHSVVHSYVVAVEVLALRQRHAPADFSPHLHAATPTLSVKTAQARESIGSLPNLDHLISPRLEEVLRRADRLFASVAGSPGGAGEGSRPSPAEVEAA
jgi:hypothetical protein